MKTGQRSLLLAFAMVAAANTASAQDARCYSFLREGVRDYKGQHVDLFSYEKVKHWLASSQFQSFDAADQAAQEIAIAPALFEIQFGEADAKSRFQQWRNDFLSSDFSQIADNKEQRSRLRTVSDALVKAFVYEQQPRNLCLDRCVFRYRFCNLFCLSSAAGGPLIGGARHELIGRQRALPKPAGHQAHRLDGQCAMYKSKPAGDGRRGAFDGPLPAAGPTAFQ
jgi:hypothetical protein